MNIYDSDELGGSVDTRRIGYLKEGIARRDKEIEKLEEEVRELNSYHTGRMNRVISYVETRLKDPHYSELKKIIYGDTTI